MAKDKETSKGYKIGYTNLNGEFVEGTPPESTPQKSTKPVESSVFDDGDEQMDQDTEETPETIRERLITDLASEKGSNTIATSYFKGDIESYAEELGLEYKGLNEIELIDLIRDESVEGDQGEA